MRLSYFYGIKDAFHKERPFGRGSSLSLAQSYLFGPGKNFPSNADLYLVSGTENELDPYGKCCAIERDKTWPSKHQQRVKERRPGTNIKLPITCALSLALLHLPTTSTTRQS